jgi:hypothetical protein
MFLAFAFLIWSFWAPIKTLTTRLRIIFSVG